MTAEEYNNLSYLSVKDKIPVVVPKDSDIGGKGKPMLNSTKHADRIKKYEEDFFSLVEMFKKQTGVKK